MEDPPARITRSRALSYAIAVSDTAGLVGSLDPFSQFMVPEARKEMEKAVNLYPKEPEYICYLAWTMFKGAKDQAEKEQAKKMVLKSLQMNPDLDKAHFFLGSILKDEGKEKEAEKRFERAIQCNPNNTEALRELRLFQMRKPTSGKAASLLGKMFKK